LKLCGSVRRANALPASRRLFIRHAIIDKEQA
jgi:hypothetical protein